MIPNVVPNDDVTASSRLLTLIAIVVVIVGLYFGRQVLIPLALAVVLAFLLTPVVGWLEKCRFGRVPAVLIVLTLAFVGFSSLGWLVAGQLMTIVDQLPSYESTLHHKIQSVRLPDGGRLKKATNTVAELSDDLSAASQSTLDKKTGKTSSSRPIPVQVAQPPSNAPQYLRAVIGPLTGILETSAMVIVFTLFMMIKREDLRNRVIRLAGQGHLSVVTRALDDGSRRLSRYLLLQFVVNIVYGAIFGIGAYGLGIPHALLWGVLASLLRFVPYIGTPIATVFPMAMALAVFPGWREAALIFGLFLVLEVIVGNVIEPWLYGNHTGISSLAILVAAVFWTILWGPVGLILSTPLTVCLILMGRYVPQLNFLEVLLGAEPVLAVEAHFYQRLLALDDEEAREIAEGYLKDTSVISFYDSVLIPALTLAEQDRHLNVLEPPTTSFVFQNTRDFIEELGERSHNQARSGNNPPLGNDAPVDLNNDRDNAPTTTLSGLRVLCVPASDEADELVAIMAAQFLEDLGCDVLQLPVISRADLMNQLPTHHPQLAVISALPPFAAGQARALCKRLRQREPNLKLLVGLWNFDGGPDAAQDRLGSGVADGVVTSLQQMVSFLIQSQGSNPRPGPLRESVTAST
ncbi:MAG TPA: AI-2E family transporter [Terriglobales bacterium]|nr:AI-2E family transporter [Terriglobales bacterium]